jgi:hypothetical protein
MKISSCTSSKQIMEKFELLYDRKHLVALGMLEEEYNTRKIKPKETMNQYLMDIDQKRNELIAMGSQISNHRHVIRILNGISHVVASKPVTSSLLSKAQDDPSKIEPMEVIGRLLDEAKLFNLDNLSIKEKNQPAPRTTALSATGKNKRSGGYKCWSCGNKDLKHECKEQFSAFCGKKGHRAYKRPNRDRDSPASDDRQVSMVCSVLTSMCGEETPSEPSAKSTPRRGNRDAVSGVSSCPGV